MKKKGEQFPINYRYVASERKVLAATPEKGIIGILTASPEEKVGKGIQTSLAFVHPEMRRKGIASAMYNILSYQVGYKPRQDDVRSPAGNAWAKSTGGHIANPGEVMMKQWDIPASEVEKNLPAIHTSDWMRGEKIDPTIAKALTPYKKPRKRKAKPPVQEQLSGIDWNTY